MSNYNSQLQSNNTDLQGVLELLQTKAAGGGENLDEEISTQETLISEQDSKIAELAEILSNKASVSYPTLNNPATAENLQEGYELIDGSGNVVTGTHVCSGGGSVETCTVSIGIDPLIAMMSGMSYDIRYTDNTQSFQQIDGSTDSIDIYVVKNTILYVKTYNSSAMATSMNSGEDIEPIYTYDNEYYYLIDSDSYLDVIE